MKRDKNAKKLDILKKGHKKNDVVIYAIALMLVTAGYFNYTANVENKAVETYSEEMSNINDITTNNTVNSNTVIENVAENDKKEDEDIGDAKLVDSNSVVNEPTVYYASTKLERDTNYANTLSTYTKIIEDSSVSETQKSIAMKEITKINDTKNAISICENLLSTKGFENYVVLVNNESINVVVKVKGGLTKQKVAQIQNIISREFNCKIENIHISEKYNLIGVDKNEISSSKSKKCKCRSR